MSSITFIFDRTKAIEAILYLASRVSESDKYGICKLLYLADKISLEKYGRFIFGELYVAMRQGATPSNAYDLLKKAAEMPINGLKVENNQVIALREPDLDCLSESDIECLDEIISKYGKRSNLDRRRAAHDEAYQKTWNNRGDKQSARISIEVIAESLPDSADLVSYLSGRDVE
jgi:uncharacterized phage-associated protein